MKTKIVLLVLGLILGAESVAINRELILVQRRPFFGPHPRHCSATEVFLKPRLLSSEEFDDAVEEFNVYNQNGPPEHTHPWIQPINSDPEDDGYAIKPKPAEFFYVQQLPRTIGPKHDFPKIQDRVNVERSVLTEEAKYICSPELNEEPKRCSNDVRRREVLKQKDFCGCDDAPIIASDAENVEKSELTEETRFIFDEELPEKEYLPSDKASEISVIEMNPEIDAIGAGERKITNVKNSAKQKRKKKVKINPEFDESEKNPRFNPVTHVKLTKNPEFDPRDLMKTYDENGEFNAANLKSDRVEFNVNSREEKIEENAKVVEMDVEDEQVEVLHKKKYQKNPEKKIHQHVINEEKHTINPKSVKMVIRSKKVKTDKFLGGNSKHSEHKTTQEAIESKQLNVEEIEHVDQIKIDNNSTPREDDNHQNHHKYKRKQSINKDTLVNTEETSRGSSNHRQKSHSRIVSTNKPEVAVMKKTSKPNASTHHKPEEQNWDVVGSNPSIKQNKGAAEAVINILMDHESKLKSPESNPMNEPEIPNDGAGILNENSPTTDPHYKSKANEDVLNGDASIAKGQQITAGEDTDMNNQESTPEIFHLDQKLMHQEIGQNDEHELTSDIIETTPKLGTEDAEDTILYPEGDADPVKIGNRNNLDYEDAKNVPKNGGASLKTVGGLFSSSLL